MTDWSKPSLTDPYASVLSELMARDTSAATMAYSSDINIPNGAIRWNPATYQFETYSSSGGNWSAWTTQFNIKTVLLGANAAVGTMQAVPRSQADTLYQAAGNYAAQAGTGSQTFLVANSAVNTQQAVPRAQADTLYAAIGGASTQAFAAKNFTATDFAGYKFSGSAGYYYMDATNAAIRVPVGGLVFCQDVNSNYVPCAVGNATAANHAIPLGQAETTFATLGGAAGQAFAGQTFTVTSSSGYKFSASTGYYYMDGSAGAVRVPAGGAFYCQDVNNNSAPCAVGTATASGHAVPLGQLQARTFVSAWQTLGTNWTISVAHNLGALPKAFGAYLVCVTAELGYAVGDAAGFDVDDGASHHGSNPVRANGSNLILATGDSTFRVINQVNASTADWTAITPGNWRLVMWGSI